jgi:DNA repair exonuclease SbcCD nuclease subunit
MAVIAYVADCHVANHKRHGGPLVSGINTRCRLVLGTLRRAVKAANDARATAFVVCGDLFDTVRPEPQVITAVAEVLRGFPNVVYLLRGNHDMASDAEGDHALGPLRDDEYGGRCVVVEKPVCFVGKSFGTARLLLVPYLRGDSSKAIPEAIASMGLPSAKHTILAFHAGVSDESTAEFLRGAPDSIPVDELTSLMSHRGIAFSVCGNWHNFRTWNRSSVTIVQCGALAPTGYDNPGLEGYGGLILYDTDDRTWRRVEIPGPRFLTVRGDLAREQYLDAVKAVDPEYLHVRWLVPAAQLGAAEKQVREDAERLGLAAGCAEPLPTDAAAVGGAVRTSVDGWRDAVRAHVGVAELPPRVSRERVLERVLGYLDGRRAT